MRKNGKIRWVIALTVLLAAAALATVVWLSPGDNPAGGLADVTVWVDGQPVKLWARRMCTCSFRTA